MCRQTARLLAFFQRTADATDIWTMPVDATRPPSTPFAKAAGDARFSPDGRFVAFVSRESGRGRSVRGAIVSPPRRGCASRRGARRMPRWSADGGEILYRLPTATSSPSRSAWEVAGDRSRLAGDPLRHQGKWPWRDFDIAPDGRFLAIVPRLMAAEQSLTVVLNWTAEVPALSARRLLALISCATFRPASNAACVSYDRPPLRPSL